MVLTILLASCSIFAQSANTTQFISTSCRVAMSSIQIHSERTHVETKFAQLSNTCLKELYLWCSRESSQRLLGFSEAIWCSFGHETLLKGEFGGDFNALMDWWRIHRDAPVRRWFVWIIPNNANSVKKPNLCWIGHGVSLINADTLALDQFLIDFAFGFGNP